VADAEDGRDRSVHLLALARELAGLRNADAESGQTLRLVEALDAIRQDAGEDLAPADLLTALRGRPGWDWVRSPPAGSPASSTPSASSGRSAASRPPALGLPPRHRPAGRPALSLRGRRRSGGGGGVRVAPSPRSVGPGLRSGDTVTPRLQRGESPHRAWVAVTRCRCGDPPHQDCAVTMSPDRTARMDRGGGAADRSDQERLGWWLQRAT
jgi:hypothetical protein